MTTWTRAQVEDLLQTEQFGYQRIALPYGLATAGDDRRVTAERIFPADLTGKSVLDLGCNHGYFCFEALRRGAARVVGYDLKASAIRRARLLAECLGARAEFAVRDIDRAPLAESFDYVLCLNVLHHLHNPLTALDGLVAASRERLILEVAGLSLFDYRRRLAMMPLLTFLMARAPVIYVGAKTVDGEQAALKYFITPRAMERLLRRYGPDFARVERLASEHKGRYLIVGHRATRRQAPSYQAACHQPDTGPAPADRG